MGFSTDSDNDDIVSTINVTPLVDVMLVLLVIFMVTAPMLQSGVEIELPKATTSQLETPEDPLVVYVNSAGEASLGGSKIALSELGDKAKAVLLARKDDSGKVYIKADKKLSYGEVMDVIAALYKSGIDGVGLVSDNS
jgi:biopolymer transport protein TolR